MRLPTRIFSTKAFVSSKITIRINGNDYSGLKWRA